MQAELVLGHCCTFLAKGFSFLEFVYGRVCWYFIPTYRYVEVESGNRYEFVLTIFVFKKDMAKSIIVQ